MYKVHLQSTNDGFYKTSKDVIEVLKNLEFAQSALDEELGTVKDGIKKLAYDMKELENDVLGPNEVSKKLIKLEGRSRRKNIRTDGLVENTNET